MSRTKMLRNGLFAAVTLSALGFGGAQAFATPAAAASARACDPYTDNQCRIRCENNGYDTGSCQVGYCRCWFW